MFDVALDLPQATMVAMVAVVAAPVVISLLVTSRRKPSNLPPYADGGILETIHAILSSDAPWFVLRNAQRFNFQPFLVNMPPWKAAFVGDGDLATRILNDPKSDKPPEIYNSFNPVVGGTNIFSASTESFRWRHSRKGMAPAFSANNIARMNRVCKVVTETMIQHRFQTAIDSQTDVLLCQEMLLLTLSTICKGALEYDISLDESLMVLHEFEIANKEFFQKSNTNPLRKLQVLQWLFSDVRRAKVASSRLQAFAIKVIDTYRAKLLVQRDENGTRTDDTVIQLVLENENYTSDKERAADILTLLFGGTETTAYTLVFTILELAKQPKETAKLRDALSRVSEEEWRNLPELRDVIRESMRLYPTAALGPARVLARDFPIDSNTTLPKGFMVFLSPMILFRNPHVYENPDSFVPSRWQSASTIQLSTFRPFAEGKRNCLGQSLANAELHYVLGHLMKHFDFEVIDPGRIEYFMTMKPDGVRVRIREKPQP